MDGVPLLVGIAGHRALEPADEPALRDSVRALLDEIVESAAHTRVVVLSTLAPGAGLLGAEVALDAGLCVIACLAAPQESYERDFTEPDLSRLRAALRRMAHVVVVEHDGSDAAARSATGWYLAFHSHILVALWDGGAAREPGGTGDVILLRETGLSSTWWASDPAMQQDPDPMPVYHVVAVRPGEPRPSDPVGTVQKTYPRRFSGDRKAQKSFEASIKRFDRYNDDLAAHPRQADDPAGLPGLMARTDRAANQLQRRSILQLRVLYAIAFLAIMAQLGFADQFRPEPLKIATLAAAFIAYRIARSADLENRYQDYRAFAEGLRVQIAWNALGGRIEYVDRYYLRMQHSELQWIRLALRSAAFVDSLAPQAADERVALNWVRQQWRYYHRAANRDDGSAQGIKRIGKTSQIVGTVTMCFATLLLLPYLHGLPQWLTLAAKHWATQITALVAAAAALFGSYSDKRGFSANAKRYDRMFGVFDRALRQLYRVEFGAAGDRRRIFHAVGHEALVEQADWLLARRDRPLRAVGR